MSSGIGMGVPGNTPPRCARCCTDVLSTQESCQAASRPADSEFHSDQNVFWSTKDVTLHRLACVHSTYRGTPVSFGIICIDSQITPFNFYFLSRPVEHELVSCCYHLQRTMSGGSIGDGNCCTEQTPWVLPEWVRYYIKVSQRTVQRML